MSKEDYDSDERQSEGTRNQRRNRWSPKQMVIDWSLVISFLTIGAWVWTAAGFEPPVVTGPQFKAYKEQVNKDLDGLKTDASQIKLSILEGKELQIQGQLRDLNLSLNSNLPSQARESLSSAKIDLEQKLRTVQREISNAAAPSR